MMFRLGLRALKLVGHPSRFSLQVLLAKPTGKRPRGCPRSRWSGNISDLAWSRLDVELAELGNLKLLLTVRYFESS